MKYARLSLVVLAISAPVVAHAEEQPRRNFGIDPQVASDTTNDTVSAEFPSGSTTETHSIALPSNDSDEETQSMPR